MHVFRLLSTWVTLFLVGWHSWLPVVHCKRVLFIPMSQKSHIRTNVHVAKEMKTLGHEVWVAVPKSMISGLQNDASDVNILAYGAHLENVEEIMFKKSGLLDSFWAGMDKDFALIWSIAQAVWKNSIDTIEDPDFIPGIEKLKPDLIVLDWTQFCRNMVIVPYKLGIPFAFFGPFVDTTNARIPFSTACNPISFSDLDDTDMSFSQRVINTLTLVSLLIYNPFCDDHIISKYVPEKPPITVSELSARAEVFVVETDYILDYVRPMLPNTKFIGGTSARPSGQLEEPFKSFADKSSKGLVIVTFGSSVLNLPLNISTMMVDAFKKTDLRFIWRANLTSGDTTSMHVSTWIPQNDLLSHKNTRVFLSHCGANGLYEALYHGIPILCTPIFADQFHNAQRVVNKGYGLRVDIRHVSSQELAMLISELAYNKTYKSNMETASKLFKQLFPNPVKAGAFWFDHVLKFGGHYMRYAGQKMPLYKFLLLDIGAAFLGLALAFAALICLFCRAMCKSSGTLRRLAGCKKEKQN